MKFVGIFGLIFSLFCPFLSANEAEIFYQKAQNFEKNGDLKNAMKFYKLAAQTAINSQNFDDNSVEINAKFSAQNTQNFDENKTLSEALFTTKFSADEMNYAQGDANIFGLETFYPNYLLPVSLAKKVPNDGRRKFETKFQLSVKKPLFADVLGFKETLYLGYTQKSWWQTAKSSVPFRETNYEPEIFANFPTNFAQITPLKNLQIGVLHSSNGRGEGDNSHSWNRIYARANFDFGDFAVVPRVWYRIPDSDDDNPDITDYAGNGDVALLYRFKRQVLSLKFASNFHLDKTNRSSFEVGYTFPIFHSFYWYLHYFNGYAESLIDYKKHTNKIGIGFLFFN